MSNKFKKWIKLKKPKIYIYDYDGEEAIGFGFKPQKDGYISDGWYIDKNDSITKSLFEDNEDFREAAEQFLDSVPGLYYEIGSCTYSLDDSVSAINYLINHGFTEAEPAWL